MVVIKIIALMFVALLGLISLVRNGPGPAFEAGKFFQGTSTEPSSYAIALYSGLWAFDGWDQCNVSGLVPELGGYFHLIVLCRGRGHWPNSPSSKSSPRATLLPRSHDLLSLHPLPSTKLPQLPKR
jgi:hypothetical protein